MKNFIKLLLVVLFVVSSLVAGDIATVTALNGGAYIDRGGEKIDVSLGMKLQEKDRIITDDKAKVQIIFNDETIITLGKNSNFSIKEYLFEDKKEPIAKFSMLRGAMRTISGKIGKVAPQRFSVATKTATIGIRGTNFTVLVGDDGFQNIFCTYGAISVAFRGEQYIIREGFYITISPEGKINIKEFKPQELKNMRSKAFAKTKAKKDTKGLVVQEQLDTTETESANIEVKDLSDQTRDSTQTQNTENAIKDTEFSSSYHGFSVINDLSIGVQYAAFIYGYNGGENHDVNLPIGYISIDESGSYGILHMADRKDGIQGQFVDISFNDERILVSLDTANSNLISLDNVVESDYVSWGSWDLSYNYKNNNYDSEVFRKDIEGLWVAGTLTEPSVVDSMRGSYNYSGGYKAYEYTGTNIHFINGTASLAVDFDQDSATLNINYAEQSNLFNMDIHDNILRGSENSSGSAIGAFYGPNAEVAAGSFVIKNAEEVQTKGVYEVKR